LEIETVEKIEDAEEQKSDANEIFEFQEMSDDEGN